jgi:hypothetical protein
MNSTWIESSFGLDRLATEDEVRRAMSSSSAQAASTACTRSQGALELVGLRDDFSEVDSDASGRGPNLREEIEWLMIARELQDFNRN